MNTGQDVYYTRPRHIAAILLIFRIFANARASDDDADDAYAATCEEDISPLSAA